MHLQGIPGGHRIILVEGGGKSLIGRLGEVGIVADDRRGKILGVGALLKDMTSFGVELQTFARIARPVERIAPDKEKVGDEKIIPLELETGRKGWVVLDIFG